MIKFYITQFCFASFLAIIVSRRVNTWKRSREFYPNFYRIYDATIGKFVTPNFDYAKCPACTAPYSKINPITSYKIMKYSGEKIRTGICTDCEKDSKSISTDREILN